MFRLLLISCLLVVIINIHEITSSESYCELELEYCNGKRHIACENNVISPPAHWSNFKLVDMSSKLRSLILEILNEYRNNIALGRIKGFPKSANMAIMSWHHEFHTLMEASVSLIEHNQFGCVATETFKYPYESSYRVCGNFTPVEVLERAMTFFTKTELSSPDDRSFSEFYTARNYKIGCAMATYLEDSRPKYVFKCLTNKWGQKSVADAYEHGDPCSHCEPRTECNDLYGGLCTREKGGPVGLTGPPGPAGPAGFPGPSKLSCP